MSASERIRQEAEAATEETASIQGTPNGEAVFFRYTVPRGKHTGRKLTMAVSMQGGENYPDIPPHFVHVPADVGYGEATPNYSYTLENGEAYHAFSRIGLGPWDNLSPAEKTMRTYINKHLPEFWKGAT